LNAIDASQSPAFAFLNFVVEVGATATAESKPLIELTPSASLKTIYLNAKKEETKATDVNVKINGSFKNLFSLTQFLTNPLQSNEGNQLDYAAVNFIVKDASKGLPVNVETPLSGSFQNIYASEANGDADQEFSIIYSLGDLSSQKAGRYTSNIQYYLEEAGGQEKLETLELVVENERIFDLSLTAQDQKSLIEFRNIRPGQEPRINEVTIEVKTNTGKQYQVSQNVYSALTSKEGVALPGEYFTLRTDGLDVKGELKCMEKQTVKIGDTVLFVSDAAGLPAKFKVIYELNIPKGLNIKIGDYSTRITYTLLEI